MENYKMLYNPQCDSCPLHEEATNVCIPARTTRSKCKYLFVGHHPDQAEDKGGTAGDGAAYALFQKALRLIEEESDLDTESIVYTNAVKCYTGEGKKPGVKAKRECQRYLQAEVEEYKPDVIIALGGSALSTITDGEYGAVGPNRLKVLSAFDTPLCVTFHPSALLYDRSKVQDFMDDLYAYTVTKIWKEDKEDVENIQVRLVNTKKGFGQVITAIEKLDRIGLDIETDGFTPHLLTAAVAVSDELAYVLPVYHKESALDGDQVKTWLMHLVTDPTKTIVGQNIKYDISMIMRANGMGFKPPTCQTEDSMLYHYMLNEHSTSRNLDYLSRAYSGIGGYKDEVDHGKLANEELTALARYNGRDAVLPILIIDRIKQQLEIQDYLSDSMTRFYSKLTTFAANMEAAGVSVDQRQLAEVKRELEADLGYLRDELDNLAPGVNLDSPKQLSTFIYDTLGIAVPDVKDAVTPAGQRSTREDVIKNISHPFVEKLLEYRGTAKLLRTYVGGIEENLWPNGRVHPQFFIAKTDFGGTVTGRLSCKRPAMQTIPRDSNIRSVFVPRYRAGRFLEFDAAQAELRVAASFSGDETLTDIFKSGIDPHQATADLCGVDRQTGKRINFAAIYGVSEWGLVERAGLDAATAKRVAATLRSEWSTLYAYFDQIKAEAIREGQVSTEYGRWRRVPGATLSTPRGRALLREAANFVIQAPASDFVQTFGQHLSLELNGLATPVMSNHDGLLFDVFDANELPTVANKLLTNQEKFATIVNDTFEVDLGVPFEWDLKVGINWKEMENYKWDD
jgi:DNA polymerase-1